MGLLAPSFVDCLPQPHDPSPPCYLTYIMPQDRLRNISSHELTAKTSTVQLGNQAPPRDADPLPGIIAVANSVLEVALP